MISKQSLTYCIRSSKLLDGGVISGPVLFYTFDLLITQGFAKEITRNEKIIYLLKSNVLNYFLARSFFLTGRYDKSITILEKTPYQKTKFIEARFLLAESYKNNGNKHLSSHTLKEIIKVSKRLKTWLILANNVNTEAEFDELYLLWNAAKINKSIPPYHFEVNGYIATAALRAKNYNKALKIWIELYQKTKEKLVTFPIQSKKKFTSLSAHESLISLKSIFDNNGIIFFLISGTLLGCIRNNELLGHDKDIDVGIWEDVSIEHLLNIISSSGLFETQAIRSTGCIRVKHVNGIAIDIFVHYRDKDNYWHAGVKLRWNNTPFELTKVNFLGTSFLVPENYDLYLTENYGDWRIPKIEFDSTFDTPNAEIINKHEILIHVYRKLCLAINNNDKTLAHNLERKLNNLNNKFVNL